MPFVDDEQMLKEQIFGIKNPTAVVQQTLPSTPLEISKMKTQLLHTIAYTNRTLGEALNKLDYCVTAIEEIEEQIKILKNAVENKLNF